MQSFVGAAEGCDLLILLPTQNTSICTIDTEPASADDSPRKTHSIARTIMSKKPSKNGPNKAKSIIAQPLFRSRQERAGKGKGSYRREAFQSNSWEASYFLAA
jgi:alternative ribosome-rescue factor